MEGRVSSALDATVPIRVRGDDGVAETVSFTLDTGFDGFLALPAEKTARLGLRFHCTTIAVLGDGSETRVPVYEATVHWHGRLLRVWVLEMEGGALLGTALVRGSRLTVEMVEGGLFRIELIGHT